MDVLVGLERCTVERLAETSLICSLPKRQPEVGDTYNGTLDNELPAIVVTFFVHFEFHESARISMHLTNV